MVRRRNAEVEQDQMDSRAAGLRGVGEQRKAFEEAFSAPETEQPGARAEEVKPRGAWPVREEHAPSVREVRVERERFSGLPENSPLPALSPMRALPKEAVGPTEVHVTIGHIEVRAAAAPARTAARKATPPSVSLQEYLSRRNGGPR
jgi:hypothetical protein